MQADGALLLLLVVEIDRALPPLASARHSKVRALLAVALGRRPGRRHRRRPPSARSDGGGGGGDINDRRAPIGGAGHRGGVNLRPARLGLCALLLWRHRRRARAYELEQLRVAPARVDDEALAADERALDAGATGSGRLDAAADDLALGRAMRAVSLLAVIPPQPRADEDEVAPLPHLHAAGDLVQVAAGRGGVGRTIRPIRGIFPRGEARCHGHGVHRHHPAAGGFSRKSHPRNYEFLPPPIKLRSSSRAWRVHCTVCVEATPLSTGSARWSSACVLCTVSVAALVAASASSFSSSTSTTLHLEPTTLALPRLCRRRSDLCIVGVCAWRPVACQSIATGWLPIFGSAFVTMPSSAAALRRCSIGCVKRKTRLSAC